VKLQLTFSQKINLWAQDIAQDKRFAIKLFLMSFLVRMLFTLLHGKIYLVSDMIGYNEAAMSLLQDGQLRIKGVISGSRPPIYPYFLMASYYLFGHSFFIVRLLQAVIGSLTAVLVSVMGKEIFDRRVGMLAGLAYAFYPASWAMGDMLLSETVFTFLMLLSVRFMIRIPQMRSPWVILWAGLFAGAAALTRTSFTPFTGIVCAGVVLLRLRDPQTISRYVLVIVIFLMTIFPWMLRNYYTRGVFTMNPKSGSDFYMYNHSSLKFIILNYEDTKDMYDEKAWIWDEVTKGEEGSKRGIAWIKQNPHLFLVKGVRMIMNIWGFDRDYLWYYIAGYYGKDPKWLLGIMVILMGLPFIIIAPLSWAGFFISKPLEDNKLAPTLILLSLHIVTFAVYGFSRHRFPYVSLLIIWAAFAFLNLDKVRDILRKGHKSWRKTAIILSWAFLLFSWIVEVLVDAGSLIGLKFVYPGF
jgi:4-amino-4-deoxy-L-arabinose transferase-like glycosyltransferase